MHCPFCGANDTKVIDSRLVAEGDQVRRRRECLRAGFQRALEKRPVSVEQIEAAIGHIKHRLRATGEREVKAMVVGEMVMRELKQLDEVAYIRFASVYRRFQDLNQFREEIERLSRREKDDTDA